MSDTGSEDAERREDEAAQAEEERLDKETPAALDNLSATAQRFLREPDLDVATARDLPDDASGEEPPQDRDPGR